MTFQPDAAEDRLELLDDLAVAADRAVEPLQVAVDDEGEVVEALARRDAQRAERLGLVGLAVAQERPDAGTRGVEEAAVLEVAVEARLVDRADRAEAHRDRRELPEVGHQPRMRIRATGPVPGHGLAPEVVELVLGQAALEEGAGVDPGRRVALVEDLVADPLAVLAPEEVVEADLVQARRAGVRREVAADAGEPGVRRAGPSPTAFQRMIRRMRSSMLLVARERRAPAPG